MRRHQIEPVELVPSRCRRAGARRRSARASARDRRSSGSACRRRRAPNDRAARRSRCACPGVMPSAVCVISIMRAICSGGGRLAHHALRPAGGAGRIGQRAMHLPRRPGIGGDAREPALPFGRARRNARIARPGGGTRRASRRVGSTTMTWQPGGTPPSIWRNRSAWMISALAPTVAQDVAGLVRLVVPVDRAGVAAGLARDRASPRGTRSRCAA